MIKVLLYTELLDFGGVEKMIETWVGNIREIKFDVLTRKIINKPLADELLSLGCNVFEINCGKYNYLARYRYASYLMKKTRYDIAHLNTMFALEFWFCDAAKRNGIRIRIAHSHNSIRFEKKKTYWVDKICKPFLRRSATAYFGCSKAAVVSLFGDINKQPIIIKNCVDAEKFKFSFTSRNEIRNEFNINDDDILIGTIGRLSKQKNYIFLIQIFEKIHQLDNRYKLIIIGEGEEKDKLVNYASLHKCPVIFTSIRKDVERLLSGIDVFSMTSFFEGFPLVCLEAQASGVPLCVSYAVPEEALLSSQSIRIEGYDIEKWVKQLMKMVPNEYEYRLKANSIIYDNRYSEQQCCDDLLSCYKTLYDKTRQCGKRNVTERRE